MDDCIECGKPVDFEAMALYRKLINRGAEDFMCKKCLASFLRVSVEALDRKVIEFRKAGCTLFLT